MSTPEEIVRRLRALSTSGRENWVREFDAGLAEIIALKDPAHIPLLMRLFDDDCEYSEAMFSLIHTVEHYDREAYIGSLLAETPALAQQAPDWLRTLYTRVLNSRAASGQVASQLKRASPDIKRAVVALLDDVVRENPEFAQKSIELRTAALS